MELPKKLTDQLKRVEKAEAKHKATVQYRRRKLDKDVREYTKSARGINSRRIDEIGRKHGFMVNELLPGESEVSRDNA